LDSCLRPNIELSAPRIPALKFLLAASVAHHQSYPRLTLNLFEAMAKRSDGAPARWRQPFHTWLDAIEKGWGIPVLIAGFAATWMVFLTIAYLGSDLHPDVLETWSVGRVFAWGNAKHPPLMGWVAHAWTLVFPLTDWSLHLLGMTNAAVALWAIDLIARRFVRGDKRAVVLLLLMLLPAYQFQAQRSTPTPCCSRSGRWLHTAFCVHSRPGSSNGPPLPARWPRLRCSANIIQYFWSVASSLLPSSIRSAGSISYRPRRGFRLL
jgi:hypothetical protein